MEKETKKNILHSEFKLGVELSNKIRRKYRIELFQFVDVQTVKNSPITLEYTPIVDLMKYKKIKLRKIGILGKKI